MATTLIQAQESYLDNADYAAEDSLTKARAFETACRRLLLLQHSKAGKGGNAGATQEINTELIAAELAFVQQWIADNDATASASIVHPDFADFRRGAVD